MDNYALLWIFTHKKPICAPKQGIANAMLTKTKTCIFLCLFTLIATCAAAVLPMQESACDAIVTGVVVIDAGHGGMDGGVVGASGIKESEINLAIAKACGMRLQGLGIRVVYTRTDEDALASTKRGDMEERRRIIVSSDPDLVISIHANKFGDTSRRGAQVFYDDTRVGQRLGEAMQQALNTRINAVYSGRANYQAQAADLFITKCVVRPSIVVECGFVSNPQDEALLRDPAYRKAVATCIADTAVAMLATADRSPDSL